MKARLALGSLAAVVAVLVLAQLVLPGIAENRLRDQYGQFGTLTEVEVAAFPALKLLLGRADRVRLHYAEARLAGGSLADLVDDARRTGELDARADRMVIGTLVVRDGLIRKDDGGLHAEAAVTDADLDAAFPADLGLRAVGSDADGLVLEARALGLAVRARLAPRDGALIIAPDGLLGGLATVTVFEDPRVRVTSVGARERPGGLVLTAEGELV